MSKIIYLANSASRRKFNKLLKNKICHRICILTQKEVVNKKIYFIGKL